VNLGRENLQPPLAIDAGRPAESGISVPASDATKPAVPAQHTEQHQLGSILTADEVAAALRLPTVDVIQAIAEGRMPGNGINGGWWVRSEALVRWLDGAHAIEPYRPQSRPRRRAGKTDTKPT
jgi:hypothetical protein